MVMSNKNKVKQDYFYFPDSAWAVIDAGYVFLRIKHYNGAVYR